MTHLNHRSLKLKQTMTVNETAHDLPPLPDSEDDVDHPRNLELEATAINQNFTQQVRGSCVV